jgi:putative ABC transport system permease protein
MYLFKIAVRSLIKNRNNTVINVLGLSISLMVSLIIALYISYHFSFDRYVNNYENSYRLITRYGDGTYNANTFACFEECLQNTKEVEEITACYTQHDISEVFAGEVVSGVKDLIFADHTFLDFFGARMVEGNMEKIDEPNIVFLTPNLAGKLFKDKNVLGKLVQLRSFTADKSEKISFTVGGIINPLPESSHINYQILVSKVGHFSQSLNSLKNAKVFGSAIYVKLTSDANTKEIAGKLNDLAEPKIGKKHGPPLNAFNYKFQSFRDIHFASDVILDLRPTVSRSNLYILGIVGLLIFIMGIINFVNIFTASVAFRGREFGIIRFLGGKKSSLWNKVAIEVLVVALLSFGISMVLSFLFNRYLAQIFFKNWRISFTSPQFWNFSMLLFVLTVSIIILILAGSISKLKQTRYNNFSIHKSKVIVPLVVFQFVLVIGLVGYTMLLNKQLNYINTKSLGYASENVMIIKSPERNSNVNICVDELNKLPGVIHAGAVQHYPGYRLQDMNFTNSGNSFPFKFGMANTDGIKALDLTVLDSFVPEQEWKNGGCLINEKFYHNLLQFYSKEQVRTSNFPYEEDAKSEGRQPFKILGVMEDFHYASLYMPIENFAYAIQGPQTSHNRFILVRYEQQNFEELLSDVKNTVSQVFPDKPFEYSFFNDYLEEQYESENTLMKLVDAFSILCIMVACLGLIGITLITQENRIKEIGIRKVNGAKVSEILALLNKDIVKWVAIAFVVATPIAWYAMSKWLGNFAYKTSLSWWIFVLSGVVALGVALLTVSWQSWKAATRNPVEALRYE